LLRSDRTVCGANGNRNVFAAAHHNAFQQRLTADFTQSGIFFFILHAITLSYDYFVITEIQTAIGKIITQINEQVKTFSKKRTHQNKKSAERNAFCGFS
jgi:hypothetical protein